MRELSQPGILAPVPKAGRYLSYAMAPPSAARRARPSARSVTQAVATLSPLVHSGQLVVGLGPDTLAVCGKRGSAPLPGMRMFPALAGPAVAVPSTPVSLWCWLRGEDAGDLLHLGRSISRQLCPGVRAARRGGRIPPWSRTHGFGLDLSGYEDGIENPVRAARARALQWPPERAAQVCGITADEVRGLARDYGSTQPAAIRLNYGMQRARGGGNAVRLVAILPCLTGAWRHRAGGLLLSASGWFPVDRAALQRPDLLAGRAPRTINMSTIGDDLLREAAPDFGPKIEALVVYNSNPLAVAPESAKVEAGLRREDLFTVVLEQFMTDTADVADYVLPATTQLEHLDVHTSYGHTWVLLNEPAIAPLGEARPNTQVFRDLAARMGFDDACFADSDETMARSLPSAATSISTPCASAAGCSCRCPRRRLPTAASPRRAASASSIRRSSACPTMWPITNRRPARRRWPSASRSR